MRFIWFNLMPWPYLPDDFREKYRSVWVDAHTRAKAAVLDLQRPGLCETRTRRWRKTDSNSRSLREGKGYGRPLQASIAVSDLNL
jgi:hypothetical protein